MVTQVAAPAPAAPATSTARVHPGPWGSYPPGTPKLEQLPHEFREYEHTLATWRAYVTHPAVVDAEEIFCDAQAIGEKLKAWLKRFEDIKDPGEHAIESAGLPVPEYIVEHGTTMRWVAEHFRGLAWAVACAIDFTECAIPEIDDEQNKPANIARLLGVEETVAVVEAEPVATVRVAG